MAKPYNHAEEELKFKKKKDAENETCRNNGMKEDAIHEKDKYDRKDFNSARRNAENSTILFFIFFCVLRKNSLFLSAILGGLFLIKEKG